MSILLQALESKAQVDEVIQKTEDIVLVLRIGRESDIECMKLDEIVSGR